MYDFENRSPKNRECSEYLCEPHAMVVRGQLEMWDETTAWCRSLDPASPRKERQGHMSTQKSNHTAATLKIPKGNAALLVLAKAILLALTNNKATFASPTPALAQFSTDIDAFDTAETATKSGTKGMVAIRDEKRLALIADLHQLLAYVQQIANLTPDQAASIIESAGMGVRKPAARTKSDLAATTVASATVKLTAKSQKGAKAHDWQYSTDGKTWIAAPSTTQSKTTIGSLPTGGLVYFRHRTLTKTGTSDWSSPVSLAVS